MWNTSIFGNDSAADVLDALSRNRKSLNAWVAVLVSALAAFEDFLDRDANGLTFRQATEDEAAEMNATVREALAEFPHLVEEWDAGGDDEDIPVDTGDGEASAAVAAAAIILDLDAFAPKMRKRSLPPEPFRPGEALKSRAQLNLKALLANRRLCEQFPPKWITNVKLLEESAADN